MNSLRYIIFIILTTASFFTYAQFTKVYRVIDGDTFETITGEKVRLIGINAPEIGDIFGIESKDHLYKLITGIEVELVSDKFSNNTDKYGRNLRYVLVNGDDINKQMISDGYAIAYLKYRFSKNEEYKNAQLESMSLDKGIWKGSIEKKEKINYSQSENINIFKVNKREIFLIISFFLLAIIGLKYYYKK